MRAVDRPLCRVTNFCCGSLFTSDRLLSACGRHQIKVHQYDLVTGPRELLVANQRERLFDVIASTLHAP
jgi:hypothetical protein